MRYQLRLVRIYYFILTRRYSVSIVGEELLQSSGVKLILPNHQSHIDPQLLAAITQQHCDFVPVVSERFLKIPVIGYFLRAWGSVAVSDLKFGNRDPYVLKKVHSQVMDVFKGGKTVIIYPSGQIAHAPVEKIINKQVAHVIVSNLPEDVKVIGVRISGLWGSMWSVAWNGKRPDFVLTFLKGIFYFFANFIFFLPKRHVAFEFVDITMEARSKAMSGRHTFNNYMEDFFNINGPEKATYIKHLFFFPKSKRKYPENLRRS